MAQPLNLNIQSIKAVNDVIRYSYWFLRLRTHRYQRRVASSLLREALPYQALARHERGFLGVMPPP